MKILTEAIVSNSEMIKKYKDCRAKAERLGKIFILRNNQPDAVLFSIAAYEKFSVPIEYLEKLQTADFEKFVESIPDQDYTKVYPFAITKVDFNQF
ncbi:MAG: hypothetical protein LLG09_04330 [Negativicutes bacterium]|nr:hypothetical protein [Negativicutes bacterium]